MPSLPPRKFTAATGALLVAATVVLALGADRLASGGQVLGYALLAVGVLLAAAAFSLRVQGDPGNTSLMLVTREQCPACREARELLDELQDEIGFDWWDVDVDADPELSRRYGGQLPVLVHDGEPVASLQVLEEDVRRIFSAEE